MFSTPTPLNFDTSLEAANTRNLVGSLQAVGNQPRPGNPTGGNVLVNAKQAGTPAHVTNVQVRRTQISDALTHVAVTFNRVPTDSYHKETQIYVSNYLGNPAPVHVASGDSPIRF